MDSCNISTAMIKRYPYKNLVKGNTVMPVPPTNYADVLYLDREGVGIRLENAFTKGDVVANVWRFRVKYKNINPQSPAEFFLISVTGTTTKARRYKILGSALTMGIIYSIGVLGVTAKHEVQEGDAISSIMEDLADQINNGDYGTFSASADVDGDDIIIFVPAIIRNINLDVVYGTDVLYVSSDYAAFSAMDRLFTLILNEAHSNTGYPEHQTILSEYDYSTLTSFSGQLVDFYKPIGYNNEFPIDYLYTTTTISDFPYLPSTTSRAVFDQQNSRIVFSNSSPLQASERLVMLYR